MADEKVINMPGAQEIMQRLAAVDPDPYLIERFYPLVAELGGRELVAPGVALSLSLKLYDFMKQGGYPPIVGFALGQNVPKFIDALVDDKEVAQEAIAFYKESTK